jgi:endonuclease/exonuclease/phosphatase family metal-dependent hydrolase
MMAIARCLVLAGMVLSFVAESARAEGGAGRFKVMTFNILCSFCNKVEFDPWTDRLGYFADIFKRHDPDIIGMQELTNAAEVQQILKLLPDYGVFFYERGKLAYPDAAIFYRKARFEVVESGLYWLSPTPEIAMTTGFRGGKLQLARLVVWTVFREKISGAKFLFACTHYDPNSPSQELSSPLVLKRMASFAAQMPVIFVGDLNSRPESKAYTILATGRDGVKLTDTYTQVAQPKVLGNQTQAPHYNAPSRIDHIFVGGLGKWTVSDWAVDMFVYGPRNRYPSDHWAISAQVEF